MKILIGFILICLNISTVSFSQETVVVLGLGSNEPIIGAKLIIYDSKSDSLFFITNNNGVAHLQTQSVFDSVLVSISSLGYENKSFYLKNNSYQTIYLKPSYIFLNPVVVSGQFQPNEKSNSLYNIDVISRTNIEEKGITNMQEALNNQLSFKTNNGQTNETSLNINGLSGSHVKIMIDGVPVEGRIRGNIDLSQINTDDIQRIEIIEGPVSVVYGTNALGGIVNIITKKYIKNKASGFINSYYETVGKYNFSGGASIYKKKHTFKLSGGRNFFAGFTLNDSLRSKIWQPREQYNANFLYGYQFKRLRLTLASTLFHEKMITKGDLKPPYYTTAFDTYVLTDRLSNRILLNGKLNKKEYVDLTLGYSYYKRKRNTYFKDLTTLKSFLINSNTAQDSTIYNNLIFRGFYSNKLIKDKFSYLFGTEFKQDYIKANRIENNAQQIGNYAVFASLKYSPIKNITIQPSIRYGYNTRYKAPLTPSIIVQWQHKKLKFKGFYAKGFRTPSLKELYLEFHFNSTINLWGNSNLEAENSDHIQLGIEYKNKHFKIESNVFYTKINKLINLVKISDIDWQYQNIGYFIAKGGKINSIIKKNNLKIGLSYSYIGNYNAQFSSDDFNNKFNFSSNFMLNTKYSLKKYRAGLTITYKYNGAINSYYQNQNGTIESSQIGDYSIFNASVFKRFYNNKITLVTGVKNILNTTNVDLIGKVYGFSTSKNATNMAVLWGRTFFVTLKLKL